MPLLDESDLDDRFVRRVRSSFKAIKEYKTECDHHAETTSGEDVPGNASDTEPLKISYPFTVLKSEPSSVPLEDSSNLPTKTDDNDGGLEDSLQIDAEDDLIDFIEKEIMDEPDASSDIVALPEALAASSPQIKVNSDEVIDDTSQNANEFLDFLQSTSQEPCLTIDTQAVDTFPRTQHGLSTLICEPKRVNVLLPIIDIHPIVPISPIIDYDPKQAHSFMQLTSNNDQNQPNNQDINTPQRSPSERQPTFDHTTTALTYTVQSDITSLIYQLLPGEYLATDQPTLGDPRNVYTLGPPIESTELQIITPDCIQSDNADDILQEAMRATFDLDSRTEVVSMSICSSPANLDDHEQEKPLSETTHPPTPPPAPETTPTTPPLLPGFKEKMCRKYNIHDSVVELTEYNVVQDAGRKLRRRNKPTNYDENLTESPSPSPEKISHSSVDTPTPIERRGKTMYGPDEDEPTATDTNTVATAAQNLHSPHPYYEANKAKGGKGKAHRKRRPGKKRRDSTAGEMDVNKRIVLKMKRLPNAAPNEEDRQKRKRSAAFVSSLWIKQILFFLILISVFFYCRAHAITGKST